MEWNLNYAWQVSRITCCKDFEIAVIKYHHLEKKVGNRRAECKQSITMYRVVLSCTVATIASAVKAQNTWPWHRHMWRGSYLSRLDFSKVSSASTHAHKSPEPRCYLPTTHTRANQGSHPRPNQNPFFKSVGRRCNHHQSADRPKMQSSSKCWPPKMQSSPKCYNHH